MHPIDYANASPDVALTSLHYYFPWAMEALVKWCVFCSVTGRRLAIDQDQRVYFDIGDRDDLSYEDKLREYRRLADDYFQVEEYEEFCATRLRDAARGRTSTTSAGPEFDALLVETVQSRLPGARARGDGRAAPRARRRLGD